MPAHHLWQSLPDMLPRTNPDKSCLGERMRNGYHGPHIQPRQHSNRVLARWRKTIAEPTDLTAGEICESAPKGTNMNEIEVVSVSLLQSQQLWQSSCLAQPNCEVPRIERRRLRAWRGSARAVPTPTPRASILRSPSCRRIAPSLQITLPAVVRSNPVAIESLGAGGGSSRTPVLTEVCALLAWLALARLCALVAARALWGGRMLLGVRAFFGASGTLCVCRDRRSLALAPLSSKGRLVSCGPHVRVGGALEASGWTCGASGVLDDYKLACFRWAGVACIS